MCPACTDGRRRHCVNLTGGHVTPGLQTGYCHDTGGGWSLAFAAHESQLHYVPDGLADEAAVLIEPLACAVHAALHHPGSGPAGSGEELTAVVIGAGTLGLCTVAALARFRDDVARIIAVAKYSHQKELATRLGATSVAEPGELRRAVRRATGSWILDSGQLSGGAPIVIDCVGSAASLADALAVTAPGGALVLAGMPAPATIDLTPLWQREVSLAGSYTYGPERAAGGRHSFDLAFELAETVGLQRLLSATYPLERAAEAIEHAAAAGRGPARRGAGTHRTGDGRARPGRGHRHLLRVGRPGHGGFGIPRGARLGRATPLGAGSRSDPGAPGVGG